MVQRLQDELYLATNTSFPQIEEILAPEKFAIHVKYHEIY